MGLGEPPAWVVYSPLLPLFLLLFTGLYMFVLPYGAKWHGGQRAGGCHAGQGRGTGVAHIGEYRGALLLELSELVRHRLELLGKCLHASFQFFLRGRCSERRRQADAQADENRTCPLDASRATRSRTGV